jgi:hypothetical protein
VHLPRAVRSRVFDFCIFERVTPEFLLHLRQITRSIFTLEVRALAFYDARSVCICRRRYGIAYLIFAYLSALLLIFCCAYGKLYVPFSLLRSELWLFMMLDGCICRRCCVQKQVIMTFFYGKFSAGTSRAQ